MGHEEGQGKVEAAVIEYDDEDEDAMALRALFAATRRGGVRVKGRGGLSLRHGNERHQKRAFSFPR